MDGWGWCITTRLPAFLPFTFHTHTGAFLRNRAFHAGLFLAAFLHTTHFPTTTPTSPHTTCPTPTTTTTLTPVTRTHTFPPHATRARAPLTHPTLHTPPPAWFLYPHHHAASFYYSVLVAFLPFLTLVHVLLTTFLGWTVRWWFLVLDRHGGHCTGFWLGLPTFCGSLTFITFTCFLLLSYASTRFISFFFRIITCNIVWLVLWFGYVLCRFANSLHWFIAGCFNTHVLFLAEDVGSALVGGTSPVDFMPCCGLVVHSPMTWFCDRYAPIPYTVPYLTFLHAFMI